MFSLVVAAAVVVPVDVVSAGFMGDEKIFIC